MNGYDLQAWGYRELLKSTENEQEREELLRKARASEYLSSCTKQERFALFDSGAFNETAFHYLAIAAERVKLKSDDKDQLEKMFRKLLDMVSAAEAEELYNKQ